MSNSDPFSLPNLMQSKRGYELWLSAAGYKPDTISRALRIYDQYVHFCALKAIRGGSVEAVTLFLVAARDRNVRPQTLLNYWKDLRLAFSWAQSEGFVAENPVEQIPRPRPSLYERERDVYYTESEYKTLLSVIPHWNWLGLRDRAIVMLLWDTGIRATELTCLTIEDISLDGQVYVRSGKAGVAYTGLLTPETEGAIRRQLLQRPHDSDYLFTNNRGQPLSRHALEQVLRKIGLRAGWSKSCYPHGFRHSFRVRLRDLGLDDTAISALLGHKTVTPTRGYGRRKAASAALEQLRRARNHP